MENTLAPSTLKELDELTEKLATAREKKAVLSAEARALEDEIEGIEAKFIAHLEDADLTQFRGKRGLVSLVEKVSVRTPKTVADKKLLGKYLEKKGIFWDMFGVNSQTLNSFYKQERDYAKEQGQDSFQLPGVDDPIASLSLSFRSAK